MNFIKRGSSFPIKKELKVFRVIKDVFEELIAEDQPTPDACTVSSSTLQFSVWLGDYLSSASTLQASEVTMCGVTITFVLCIF